MAVFVGIDEAGFGPILGPLVVSSAAFSLPRDLLETDLWQILRKSIADRRKHLAGRLLIADSKKAYTRSTGTKHLERTILSSLKCLNHAPTTLAELLKILSPESLERLHKYPWYENTAQYEISPDQTDIDIASTVFTNDLATAGMKLLHISSTCLDVGYYNKMVETVKNKATVLFSATSQLIKHAYDNFGTDDLQIVVDRQGGRTHYRNILLRMFPGMALKILTETPATSSYELNTSHRRMKIHFVVKADTRFLPVSLASMASKFLRELMIDNINRYFAAHCAQLRPTAGYWTDGLRFIDDLKKNIPHITYDPNLLIRSR